MLHIASSTSKTRRLCCSQVKQAELEAQLEELRDAIAHQSQLNEASKQEEAWLRQLLLPSQSQVCRMQFTTHLLSPAVDNFQIVRQTCCQTPFIYAASTTTLRRTPLFVLSFAAHHHEARSALCT